LNSLDSCGTDTKCCVGFIATGVFLEGQLLESRPQKRLGLLLLKSKLTLVVYSQFYVAIAISNFAALIRAFGKSLTRNVGPPKRILVVRVDHIGDAILTTPAIAALRNTFRSAEITVACGSWSVDVFRGNPNIDQVVVVDCPWWLRKRKEHSGWYNYVTLLRSIGALRRNHYDLMIDFRGDPRHVICFGVFAGIPRLAGIDRLGTRASLDVSSRPTEDDYEIDRSMSVARALGATEAVPPVTIPINDENRRFAAELVPNHGPFLVLHTGGKPVNRWPLDCFIALLRKLLVLPNLSIVVIGGAEDCVDAARLAEIDPKRIHIAIGRLKIPSVAALIERAAVYVGVDSGPMHLLHAVTTPAILLFGPTSPGRFAPRRPGIHIISAPQCCSQGLHEICLCSREGTWSACMQSLAPELVLDAVTKVLNCPVGCAPLTSSFDVA
jgi:ADP-heptose:LPS heptosyltransferase